MYLPWIHAPAVGNAHPLHGMNDVQRVLPRPGSADLWKGLEVGTLGHILLTADGNSKKKIMKITASTISAVPENCPEG